MKPSVESHGFIKSIRDKWFSGEEKNPNKAARARQLKLVMAVILIGMAALLTYRMLSHNRVVATMKKAHFASAIDDEGNGSQDRMVVAFSDQLTALKKKIASEKKHLIQKNSEGAATALSPKAAEHLASVQAQLNLIMLKLSTLEKHDAKRQSATAEGDFGSTKSDLKSAEKNQPTRPSSLPLESTHYDYTPPSVALKRSPKNYVWPNSFVEGIIETGQMADAGMNGTHNQGVAVIRLISPGNMPNNRHSHLTDCRVSTSYYGDLSGNSVVMHLQTLSCANQHLSLSKKVYGAVFDRDAMQDLRGVPVLKAKPILGYAALAGALSGLGRGLTSSGSTQTVSPESGVAVIQTGSLLRSGIGQGLSTPADKISAYLMKIADLYHPLVVAHAGRRVTLLFTKGFWIDKTHEPFDADGERGSEDEVTSSTKSDMKLATMNLPTLSSLRGGHVTLPKQTPSPLTNQVAARSHNVVEEASQAAESAYMSRSQQLLNANLNRIEEKK